MHYDYVLMKNMMHWVGGYAIIIFVRNQTESHMLPITRPLLPYINSNIGRTCIEQGY